MVKNYVAGCLKLLSEDAFGENFRRDSLITGLNNLTVVRRSFQWKVIPSKHVVLKVDWDEGRLENRLELLRHVLTVLAWRLLLAINSLLIGTLLMLMAI